MSDGISSFHGEYRFLSNFYESDLLYQGSLWRTLEHAFQAAKTNVLAEKEVIRDAFSPGNAKALGRQATMRADWNEVRLQVMKELLKIKFSKEPLKSRLLATGDRELIEGNTWNDTFWGVSGGRGENRLGKLLMEVRKELQVH